MKESNYNILIVEDSKSITMQICNILESNGYTDLHSVDSGEEAIELTKKNEYDLIIMDIELAGTLDGIESAARIKEMYNIPIIVMTGRESLDHANRAESLGIYSYLVKPVTEIMLISNIRLTLKRHMLEQKIYNSELKFRSLFENMYDAFTYGKVLFDDSQQVNDFQLVEANRSFYDLIGSEPVEVLGKGVLEMFPLIPKYFPNWKKILKRLVSDNNFTKYKLKVEINKNIYILFFYLIMDRSVACVIEDLTENIQKEKYIQYTKEKYELLFNSSFDAHITVDKNGFSDCNKATLEVFGLDSINEIIGKTPVDFSPATQPDGISSEVSAKEKMNYALEHGHKRFTWLHKRKDGQEFYADVMLSRYYRDNVPYIFATVRDINSEIVAQKQLNDAHKQIHDLVESIDSILIGVGINDLVTHWSKKSEEVLHLSRSNVIGETFSTLTIDWDWNKIFEAISNAVITESKITLSDVKYTRHDGNTGFLGITINPIMDEDRKLCGYLIFGNDITHKRNLELEVLQSQKLRSIGELAAGIAHEINTPIQYVHDNILFFKDSCHRFSNVISKFIKPGNEQGKVEYEQLFSEINTMIDDEDLLYLFDEVPLAVDQTVEGINHIIRIVKSMKSFSHPDNEQKRLTNINKAIQDTVIISKNEWKYVADCTAELDQSLPEVVCFPADINQVFLNIIVNAAHAIRDAVDAGKYTKGEIIIRDRLVKDYFEVTIQDNGSGIEKSIHNRIFDPFFTTKEIGKGTGQGLAISYSIVVNKHHGKLFFDTAIGEGTTFYIQIPMKDENGGTI